MTEEMVILKNGKEASLDAVKKFCNFVVDHCHPDVGAGEMAFLIGLAKGKIDYIENYNCEIFYCLYQSGKEMIEDGMDNIVLSSISRLDNFHIVVDNPIQYSGDNPAPECNFNYIHHAFYSEDL